MDYRLKANRREAFVRWFVWSIKYKDCDTSVWLTNYLNKRFEHNYEQMLWFCWIYGNTYQLPTSWIIMQEFPDFELATQSRLEDWNTKYYKKLRYQTDLKWNKGHLPSMFASYCNFIGKKTQKQGLELHFGDNEKSNFNLLWSRVNSKLHKFGRYSTWFYLQHLKQTCNLPIEPNSLMLSDYAGSRSHRNGLLHVLGEEDICNSKLTNSKYASLESQAQDILEETKSRFPEIANEVDLFRMETCLCSFKKIFRHNNGRYLGYYLDRQYEEIKQAESDGWAGIDWQVIWQARQEELDPRLNHKLGIMKFRYTDFIETGLLDNLEWLFADEPNPDIVWSVRVKFNGLSITKS